jgi:hypothetical protein
VQGRLDRWLFNEYQLAHINNYKLRYFVARYPFLRKPGTCVYGMKCLSSISYPSTTNKKNKKDNQNNLLKFIKTNSSYSNNRLKTKYESSQTQHGGFTTKKYKPKTKKQTKKMKYY